MLQSLSIIILGGFSTMASCFLCPLCHTCRMVQRPSPIPKIIHHGDKQLRTAIRCFSTLKDGDEKVTGNVVSPLSSFGEDNSGESGGGFTGSDNSSATSSSTTSTSRAVNSIASLNGNKLTQPLTPPGPETFPAWSYEPRPFFHFELLYESKKSLARVGRIHTPHGIIDTPGYVSVATNAALKGVDFRDADSTGQQLIFCNTYHLLLQPGTDVVEGAGGLHNFINRKDGPLITDSGGFQVFSLAYGSVHEELSTGGELKRASQKKNGRDFNENAVKVNEEGVLFRSYRDGRKIPLTPESTVQAQKAFGADIIIPLDELPPYHIDDAILRDSVERTHRWEARSLKEHLKNVRNQAMYCVIHGGLNRQLRKESVNYLTSLPFDGYAIGGSLGKNGDELMELLGWMMPMFNEDGSNSSGEVMQGHVNRRNKPRHLLGIADEPSILGAVRHGIDTMDSCYPTRLSRHGTLLSREGKVHIKSGRYSRQYGVPVDRECNCSTCLHYDRPYLWHLFKAKEPVFVQLATIHNLQYMNDLMEKQRQMILEGKI
eukprot:CCRYP_020102-RA/>CCRYP_020102-RA protein AED:0.06 eAED:0.06 QI:653/1/1/1/0.75/0.6/5/1324/543